MCRVNDILEKIKSTRSLLEGNKILYKNKVYIIKAYKAGMYTLVNGNKVLEIDSDELDFNMENREAKLV